MKHFVVFEKKPESNLMKQISIGFATAEEAGSFIATMRVGRFYTLHPEYELLTSEIDKEML